MFNIGILEVLIISIGALIIFGPEQLPRIFLNIKKMLYLIRKKSSFIQETMEREINELELNDLQKELSSYNTRLHQEIKNFQKNQE